MPPEKSTLGSRSQLEDYEMCISSSLDTQFLYHRGLDSFGQQTASDLQQYEYKEPDENFISIDDAKVENFLLSLVEKERKSEEEKQLQMKKDKEPNPIILTIDLDDDDDDIVTEINVQKRRKSIEEIQLTDGESARQEDEIVILNSDDEENNMEDNDNTDYIDENEDGIEVSWNDLEQTERPAFQCSICSKKVLTSYNLRRHMMIHTGERPFGCDICSRGFREFSDFKKHRRRHCQEKNFKCMICKLNKPSAKDPTKCSTCNKKRLSYEKSQTDKSPSMSAQKQKQLTLGQSFKISPFSNFSPQPGQEEQQQQQMLPILNTQQILDKIEPIQRSVRNRVGVLTRKEYPCPLCKRPFGTKHNLKRHFMIHTGEKPFNCSTCRKPFREYSTLKKHLHTHTRDRWYKCDHCIEKFKDYVDYTKHKKIHAKQSFNEVSETENRKLKNKSKRRDSFIDSDGDDDDSDDSLECFECGLIFTDIEIYTSHLKEHDPSFFVFECYICKKMFEQREKLIEHISTHDYTQKDDLSDKEED